jgi:hypothetical protein
MPRPVAVVFVHGIATMDPDYHKPMQALIARSLPKAVAEQITFRSVYWADPVRKRQRRYLDAVQRAGLFRKTGTRSLVVEGLGDAAAYQKTKQFQNSSYFEIQAKLREVLDDLDQQGLPDRPLIFIGHSLGCHIVSSFAWDINSVKQMPQGLIQKEHADVGHFVEYLRGGSPFRRLDTLAGLVMMGSNMPLFTFTFGPDKVFPITRSRNAEERPAFPGAALDEETRTRASWLNFYSRHDLLGYPLRPLNKAYADEPRLTDVEVVSEGWWRRIAFFLFPVASAYAAHTGYWTTRRVVKDSARLIASIATVGDPPPKRRFSRGYASSPADKV